MHKLAHHFATMAYNNAWANHRLLREVAKLSQEEFVAKRVGFFPSIAVTLNHNITVDWYYVDALERSFDGRPPNETAAQFFDPEQPFSTCRELQEAQRLVDKRLVNLCVAYMAKPEEHLDKPVALPRRHGLDLEPASRLLAHLFQHQIHHRGQAHAMLAGSSVKPPQLDEFFCAAEASLRAQDLTELGYSEDLIWKQV